jgi:DNA-binding MarR family transcriptional regulator
MKSSDPFVIVFQQWFELFMHSNVRSLIKFSKDHELSMSQVGALFKIDHQQSGVAGIGEHLGVTSAAASQMLQRLVEQGLVLRSEDPGDRRAKQVVLTEKGRCILDEVNMARQGQLAQLASTLTDVEKEQVIAAFNLLIAKAGQLEPESAFEVK